MNIDVDIPGPFTADRAASVGYDISGQTLTSDFRKGTRTTARQLSSRSAGSEGFRQYLIPSTSSSSPTKLANNSPRIIVSSPGEDVCGASLTLHSNQVAKSSWVDSDPETAVDPKEARRTHNRSFFMAIAVATIVLIIVIIFIVLLIDN